MLNLFARKTFSEKVKLNIIKKAARCQMCNLLTDCGECAHIVASSNNGPRNKRQIIQEGVISSDYEVNREENGLYLCANCHTLIDRNPDKYTFEFLHHIKDSFRDEKTQITEHDIKKSMNDSSRQDLDIIDNMNCPKCKKSFSTAHGLRYHIDHNVCQKNRFVCSSCNKEFTTLKGLDYHNTNNVCTKNHTNKIKLKLLHKKICEYDDMNHDELVHELVYLRGKYESLKKSLQIINSNVITIPKGFGKEDMKYIQQKLGPIVTNHTFNSIPCLFDKIHNNQKTPESHKIIFTSECMISDGKEFKHHAKKTIIDQIIESKRSIINGYIDSYGEQLGEKVLQKYEQYQYSIDEDSGFGEILELEIGGMLLDMKSVIANDEKTRQLLDKVDIGQFELRPNEDQFQSQSNNE